MRIKRVLKITAIVVGVLVVAAGVAIYYFAWHHEWSSPPDPEDPFTSIYAANCAVCHGDNMEGAAQGPALVGVPLVHGASVADLTRSIANGVPETTMQGWSATLDPGEVRRLAILIAETRENLESQLDFKVDKPLTVPTEPIETERLTVRLEVVATGIDPYPFSIAPLPDGRILVTEKRRGLSVIYPDGTRSEPLAGAPETLAWGFKVDRLLYGFGWHLDVALHPEYETNGWIYLHHTHPCRECMKDEDWLNKVVSKVIDMEKSMNRLIRGRIKDGKWVDTEVIWSAPREFYSLNPGLAAGGRIAFDPAGYVFLSVGSSRGDEGVQDLGMPFGKIHRVHDDGTMPADNPFLDIAGAQPSIWTYGHRVPQGLEFDPRSGTLWGSELGPRGGDEINLLHPGKNYGWPLYSKGLHYDGRPVDHWREAGVAFEDIEQPVVDLTPAPAVSSFIIYDGDAFPEWQGDFLVGSLKATDLYRVVIEEDRHVHTETLITDLARIRDIEMGPDGLVYLLLENGAGSQIVRVVPESR